MGQLSNRSDFAPLAGAMRVERNKIPVRDRVRNLNGLTADFAVLDVGLVTVHRKIQDHGDSFEAVRAFELLFDFFHDSFYSFELEK